MQWGEIKKKQVKSCNIQNYTMYYTGNNARLEKNYALVKRKYATYIRN